MRNYFQSNNSGRSTDEINDSVGLSQVSNDTIATSPLLTPEEIASELRCSRAHVYNILSQRIQGLPVLSTIRIGRRTLVRRGAFQNWLLQVENAGAQVA